MALGRMTSDLGDIYFPHRTKLFVDSSQFQGEIAVNFSDTSLKNETSFLYQIVVNSAASSANDGVNERARIHRSHNNWRLFQAGI